MLDHVDREGRFVFAVLAADRTGQGRVLQVGVFAGALAHVLQKGLLRGAGIRTGLAAILFSGISANTWL